MSWKKKLGTSVIVDEEVDAYLKGEGFTESTLNPIFKDDWSFVENIVDNGAPCLYLKTTDPDNRQSTMHIYVAANELYMEVITDWDSLDRSYHIHEWGITMENIDQLMDKLIEH
ncbi:hypothetical protein [Bacillus phage vB_BceM_Bc431v3]|uniref:Uncharacterized protein n=1 Tax=Bacillus phage vB_BceM_Bc431v3 TaxID=1195072 RepID=M4HNJ6_9CAUD|nr:hypothetical protein K201_gp141 [Bacillus phage vB_BceM_Bc431v3]AFQ96449.1 hypothetical protein [Bacillus phage vB_BceM_Bc431v3]